MPRPAPARPAQPVTRSSRLLLVRGGAGQPLHERPGRLAAQRRHDARRRGGWAAAGDPGDPATAARLGFFFAPRRWATAPPARAPTRGGERRRPRCTDPRLARVRRRRRPRGPRCRADRARRERKARARVTADPPARRHADRLEGFRAPVSPASPGRLGRQTSDAAPRPAESGDGIPGAARPVRRVIGDGQPQARPGAAVAADGPSQARPRPPAKARAAAPPARQRSLAAGEHGEPRPGEPRGRPRLSTPAPPATVRAARTLPSASTWRPPRRRGCRASRRRPPRR